MDIKEIFPNRIAAAECKKTTDEHARLGPSNKRWAECPGSVREEEPYPDFAGEAAIDGTGTHLFVELMLIEWRESNERPYAEDWIGRIIGVDHHDKPQGWLIKKDRAERAEIALIYIDRRLIELGITIQSVIPEGRTNPGRFFGRQDWWGTCDITFTSVGGVFEVMDYKDGRGYVSEKNNGQLTDYAFGQLMDYFEQVPDLYIDTIRLGIIQPKTNPPIRYIEMSVDELVEITEKRAHAAALTDTDNAPLIAGDHCQWCSHKPNCTARTAIAAEGINLMTTNKGVSAFDALSTVAISDMSNEQLADLKDARPVVNEVFDAVDKEVLTRIKSGETIRGYALGKGKGSNKWADDEEVTAKKLKGMRCTKVEIYPARLITPAQALKLERLTEQQVKKMEGSMISYIAGKETVIKSVSKGDDKPEPGKSLFADVAAKEAAAQVPVVKEIPIVETVEVPAPPTSFL